MSTLSKFHRLRDSSDTTKKSSTIICLEITSLKIQKLTLPSGEKIRVKNTQSSQIQGQLVQKSAENASNKNLHNQKCGEIPALHASQKKPVKQFTTQINWLFSIRDQLLPKGISKQTEFRFAVSEQDLADNRNINKWQVTFSMYNLFDRCNFCKVCMSSFLDTNI